MASIFPTDSGCIIEDGRFVVLILSQTFQTRCRACITRDVAAHPLRKRSIQRVKSTLQRQGSSSASILPGVPLLHEDQTSSVMINDFFECIL